VLECIASQSNKTPAYTVIVWAGSVFLQYLPPKRSCFLGQRGYVYTLYCNCAWMSTWDTAWAAMRLPATNTNGSVSPLVPAAALRLDGLSCWVRRSASRAPLSAGCRCCARRPGRCSQSGWRAPGPAPPTRGGASPNDRSAGCASISCPCLAASLSQVNTVWGLDPLPLAGILGYRPPDFPGR
jgi:hypothetical protein